MTLLAQYIPWAVVAGLVIFNVYIVYDFYRRLRTAQMLEGPFSRWQRWLMAARGSLTLVVLKLGTIFWSSILFVSEFSDLIAMPEVKDALNNFFGTNTVAAISLFFIAIAYIARVRRMSDQPVSQ